MQKRLKKIGFKEAMTGGLEIYTTEDGIQCARLKNKTDKRSLFIVVPDKDIYTEKVEE